MDFILPCLYCLFRVPQQARCIFHSAVGGKVPWGYKTGKSSLLRKGCGFFKYFSCSGVVCGYLCALRPPVFQLSGNGLQDLVWIFCTRCCFAIKRTALPPTVFCHLKQLITLMCKVFPACFSTLLSKLQNKGVPKLVYIYLWLSQQTKLLYNFSVL